MHSLALSAREAAPRPAVLAVLLALAFVGALDQTVIASALPVVLVDLHVPFADLDSAAWIITAYLLGYVAVMPIAGRLSDAAGRRSVLLGGLAAFAAGSLAASLAPGLLALDVARGLQAMGGGALLPVCLAVVGDTTAAARRGMALGLLGAAAELGGVAGPPYGALVIGQWGWRAIFLINLPLCLALGWAVWSLVPARQRGGSGVPLDLGGALLLAGALAAFAAGTAASGSLGGTGAAPAGANRLFLLLCALLLAAFWWVERHSRAPLLDPAALRRRRLAAAGLANLLLGVALVVVLIDVPVYAALVLGWSPTTAGILLVRFLIFLPLGALGGGYLSDRIGRAPVALAGFGLAAAAFAAMAGWTARTPGLALTAALAAGGTGLGLATAPISGGALGSLAAAAAGTAAGLVTALRVVGMMGGLAVLTTWGIARFRQMASHVPFPFLHLSSSAAVAHQQISAYQSAIAAATATTFSGIFAATMGVCLAACLPALLLGRAGDEAGGEQRA